MVEGLVGTVITSLLVETEYVDGTVFADIFGTTVSLVSRKSDVSVDFTLLTVVKVAVGVDDVETDDVV